MHNNEDPYQRVAYNGVCRTCGIPVRDTWIYYWPATKGAYCTTCGKAEYDHWMTENNGGTKGSIMREAERLFAEAPAECNCNALSPVEHIGQCPWLVAWNAAYSASEKAHGEYHD